MVQEYNKVRLLTFNFNITQSTITLRITYNFPNAGKKREKKVAVANDVTDGKQEEQESEGTLSFSLPWLLSYLHDITKCYQFNIM